MKVIAYRSYGSPEVLELVEAPRPDPGPGEVRIRIRAATVSSTDATFRRGTDRMARLASGLSRPKHPVLGTELAGEIDAVGEGVTRFAVGDAVVAATGDAFGAHAEYVCLPEEGAIGPKPTNATWEEAAALAEGTLTALPFLRDHGAVGPGQQVLILGASGSVGVAAVQLAKHLGAEVTAVCSGRNAELVRSLGADHVVDYTTADFTASGGAWDVIFDTVGASSFARSRRVLKPGGIYLATVLSAGILWYALWTRWLGRKRAKIAFTGLREGSEKAADLRLLRDLVEAGAIRPVIDRTFPLEQAAEAHRLVDGGHKRGNAVLRVA